MFLEEVITVKEAADIYQKDISTIKRNIYKNFKNESLHVNIFMITFKHKLNTLACYWLCRQGLNMCEL